MPEHTPLPWKIDEIESGYIIRYPESRIAVAHVLGNVGQPMQANARMIVRAVNAHEKLIGAVQKYAGWYRDDIIRGKFGNPQQTRAMILEDARALLVELEAQA